MACRSNVVLGAASHGRAPRQSAMGFAGSKIGTATPSTARVGAPSESACSMNRTTRTGGHSILGVLAFGPMAIQTCPGAWSMRSWNWQAEFGHVTPFGMRLASSARSCGAMLPASASWQRPRETRVNTPSAIGQESACRRTQASLNSTRRMPPRTASGSPARSPDDARLKRSCDKSSEFRT